MEENKKQKKIKNKNSNLPYQASSQLEPGLVNLPEELQTKKNNNSQRRVKEIANIQGSSLRMPEAKSGKGKRKVEETKEDRAKVQFRPVRKSSQGSASTPARKRKKGKKGRLIGASTAGAGLFGLLNSPDTEATTFSSELIKQIIEIIT